MKKGSCLLVVLALFGLLALPTQGAVALYTGEVKATGLFSDKVYVQLTDKGGAFSNSWFSLGTDSNTVNRMLAVALTAIANDRQVYVYVDINVSYAAVQALYVLK